MIEGLACHGREEEFQWPTDVTNIDRDTGEIDVVAHPSNPVCKTCLYFNECLEQAIQWGEMKEREEQEGLPNPGESQEVRTIN